MDEEEKFLTPREVSERYRGKISEKTLANWRCASQGAEEGRPTGKPTAPTGPVWIKAGGRVFYPASLLRAWEITMQRGVGAPRMRETRWPKLEIKLPKPTVPAVPSDDDDES